MRTQVSKVLIGKGIAYKDISTLAVGEICGFDFDTPGAITAVSKKIGFARGTTVLGEPVLSAPIDVKSIISASRNNYEAAVLQKYTLTVSAVPTAEKTAIFRLSYKDNLSIIPNQIKQTVVAITADAADTTATFAAKIAAEFNKQEFLFATVTVAANVVTITAIIMLTSSQYNHIDRPESVNFEVGVPTGEVALGVYVVAETVAPKLGQGSPAKMAWMEEQSMGRRGFSDRRSWNAKKFTTEVDSTKNYNVLVINSNLKVEGDMQDTRDNPIGVVLGITTDTVVGVGLFYEQLVLAVTLKVIPASS